VREERLSRRLGAWTATIALNSAPECDLVLAHEQAPEDWVQHATGRFALASPEARERFLAQWIEEAERPRVDVLLRTMAAERVRRLPVAPGGELRELTDDAEPAFRTLAEYLINPDLLRLPEAVVPRLAWRGRTTLLAGREKGGKSTIAGLAAAAKSAGRIFLDERLEPGRVLWVAVEEHPGDYMRRFVDAGADPELVVLSRLPGGLASLPEIVAEVRPTLTVLDTLFAAALPMLKDIGDTTGWQAAMNQLTRAARDSDTAVLALHHARKSDGTYRDSTAIAAGVDMVIEMHQIADAPTRRLLKPKGRWMLGDYAVEYRDGEYHMASSGATPIELRVFEFIRANLGCSKGRLRDGVGGRAAEIDRALDVLVDRGLVVDGGTANARKFFPAEKTDNDRDRVRDASPVQRNSLRDIGGTGLGTNDLSQSQSLTGIGTDDGSDRAEARDLFPEPSA
jgi:hypothetical protein